MAGEYQNRAWVRTLDSCGSGFGEEADSREISNEPSSSINAGEFVS
jgi:hypothetical protein